MLYNDGMINEEYYTTAEVAKILKVSYKTVRRMIESGKIKTIDVGFGIERKSHRILAGELDRFVAKQYESNRNDR